MKPRLFFYGNPIDDETRRRRGITTDSPAGTRKMTEVARALRAAGVRVVLVSMGRGRSDGSGRFDAARIGQLNGIPVLYGPMLHRRGLSEVLSMAWVAWTAARLAFRARAARHLFYNQFTAYLPALVILRAMRRATVCDIEDGPVSSEERIKWRTRGNAPPRLFASLISHGALVACTALSAGTRIRPTLPCYGAVAPDGSTTPIQRGSEAVVIMTGTFDDATGVDLLKAAFAEIATNRDAFTSLRFEFAGFGPELVALQREAERWGIAAVFHGRLDPEAYAALLQRAAIGLSLKALSGPYAQSTFPSKVIEYAQSGLCVIATDISDVRHVLEGTALYLEADDLAQFLAHLRRAVSAPGEIVELGNRARQHVKQTLSYSRVGEGLRRFLFAERLA